MGNTGGFSINIVYNRTHILKRSSSVALLKFKRRGGADYFGHTLHEYLFDYIAAQIFSSTFPYFADFDIVFIISNTYGCKKNLYLYVEAWTQYTRYMERHLYYFY